MKNGKLIFLLIILLSICAVSHVSATDALNSTEVALNDEMVITDGSNYQFNDSDSTFIDVKNGIESASDGDKIYLNGTKIILIVHLIMQNL